MSAQETEAELEAVAPSTLKGWASFQRAVNVTLPQSLNQTAKLLAQAGKALARG